MPGGSRKTHTKSRNGCGQCKKRRKKCDQRTPICTNCERWGVVCDYIALTAAVSRVVNRVFDDSIYADNKFFSFVSPNPTLLDAQGLGLLQHYANSASRTLSTQSTLDVWQNSVPAEAKTHHFLMHSLLALSALHLSYVRNDERIRYVAIAKQQHEKALAAFRSSVQVIDCFNGNAAMAFTFLTVVFSVGVPIVFGFSQTPSPTSAFVDILGVLRHAHFALHHIIPGVEKGSLGSLIAPGPSSAKSCAMHGKGREVLSYLERCITSSPESEDRKDIYLAALDELKNFAAKIQDSPPVWAYTLFWPIAVPASFFDLLRQKQSIALVLLAYWCVPVYRSPNLWFNDWARKIVAEICTILEGDWSAALVWPAEQVGVIPKEYHIQPCLCLECCVCEYCKSEARLSSQSQRPFQEGVHCTSGHVLSIT